MKLTIITIAVLLCMYEQTTAISKQNYPDNSPTILPPVFELTHIPESWRGKTKDAVLGNSQVPVKYGLKYQMFNVKY